MATFICTSCNKELPVKTNGGTGYGIKNDNKKVCYSCCAKQELQSMLETGKATLYFNGKEVTDWAGHLKFKVLIQKKSKHNFARVRYDYWFLVECALWHGYTIGDNTQIAHCKRVKD